MNQDEIKYSIQNLRKRKLRSSLSVLSILIGIAAIFALISFGLGIQSYIDTIAEEAGIDKLFIQVASTGAPGIDESFFLTKEDIDFTEKINGVNEIAGIYTKVVEVKFKDQVRFNFINGLDPEKIDFIEETFTVDVEKGRTLKKSDNNKVVLGHNYQLENKIFSKTVKLGNTIEINNKEFEVIGFYEEVGNPQDDSNLYITFEAFESLFPDRKDKFGFVILSADKNIAPSELAENIEEKLRKFRDEDKGKETFFVQTFEDALETFGNIINVLNGVLILIAFISLIVATVNIMNTMYTAVLDRTKEIGIMKAIGAKNNTILSIFIFESGMLGLIGGTIGIIIGYIVASIGGRIAANAGFSILQPIFPFPLIIGCLAFSFFVGALAGLLPARQASKLKPVEALRYE